MGVFRVSRARMSFGMTTNRWDGSGTELLEPRGNVGAETVDMLQGKVQRRQHFILHERREIHRPIDGGGAVGRVRRVEGGIRGAAAERGDVVAFSARHL